MPYANSNERGLNGIFMIFGILGIEILNNGYYFLLWMDRTNIEVV
jgi:hypothetical protein